MMTPGVTPEIVAQHIRDKRGNIAAVAVALHTSRQTVYRYIEKHAKLKDVLAESRESMLDMVESVLYSKALEGESWAVCFFLKTQGKSRGYIERSEVSGVDGSAIKVEYVNDWRKDTPTEAA